VKCDHDDDDDQSLSCMKPYVAVHWDTWTRRWVYLLVTFFSLHLCRSLFMYFSSVAPDNPLEPVPDSSKNSTLWP